MTHRVSARYNSRVLFDGELDYSGSERRYDLRMLANANGNETEVVQDAQGELLALCASCVSRSMPCLLGVGFVFKILDYFVQ